MYIQIERTPYLQRQRKVLSNNQIQNGVETAFNQSLMQRWGAFPNTIIFAAFIFQQFYAL